MNSGIGVPYVFLISVYLLSYYTKVDSFELLEWNLSWGLSNTSMTSDYQETILLHPPIPISMIMRNNWNKEQFILAPSEYRKLSEVHCLSICCSQTILACQARGLFSFVLPTRLQRMFNCIAMILFDLQLILFVIYMFYVCIFLCK